MTIIDQIRAEIERLKGQLVRGACAAQIQMETACKEEAYNEVLAKLDTLQEQPVELEEEIERISKNEYFDFSDWKAIARHFAEWQKEQMMKEAVGVEVIGEKRDLRIIDSTQRCLFNAKRGDWLKILIIKED